jgi:hypothetical protein
MSVLAAVLELRAVVLTLHDDLAGDMGDAHRAVGLVDVLAAGAGRAVGVDPQVLVVDFDFDVVLDHRIDADSGETGLAPAGPERRYAHQPVRAGLGLQPAIGIVPADLHGSRLDAGLAALGLLDPFDLVAVRVGPADIHPRQHLGEVLGVGPAGAGMDLEKGVVVVGLARQQAFDTARLDPRRQGFERRLAFGPDAVVALGLGHLDQFNSILVFLDDLPIGADGGVEMGPLAHQFLGLAGIAPEIGVLGKRVQLVESASRGIVVKDASSAARATA